MNSEQLSSLSHSSSGLIEGVRREFGIHKDMCWIHIALDFIRVERVGRANCFGKA